MGTINKTIEQINLLADGIYGGIHQHDNATSQSIPTGVTYTKLTEWADNDSFNNTVPDQSASEITLTYAGDYKIESQLSFASGTNNTTMFVSAFLDGVELDECHFTRKISVADDIGSASFTGIVTVTAGQVLDLRIRHDDVGSVAITVQYGTINATLVAL